MFDTTKTKKEEQHQDLARDYVAWGRMVRERRRQRSQYLRTVVGNVLKARYKLAGTACDASLTYKNIGDDTEQKDALLQEELSVR